MDYRVVCPCIVHATSAVAATKIQEVTGPLRIGEMQLFVSRPLSLDEPGLSFMGAAMVESVRKPTAEDKKTFAVNGSATQLLDQLAATAAAPSWSRG